MLGQGVQNACAFFILKKPGMTERPGKWVVPGAVECVKCSLGEHC